MAWPARSRTSPTLQYLVKLRNPTNSAVNTTVTVNTELGSDSGTTILGDSSGNRLHTKADRWLVSGDAANAPFGDPIVTQVLRGRNAPAATTVPDPLATADDCLGVDYAVKVPRNATRYLLLFAELHSYKASGKKAALADATKYDRQRSMTGVLKGIAPKLFPKIVNWDLKK